MAISFFTVEATTRNFKNTKKKRNTSSFKSNNFKNIKSIPTSLEKIDDAFKEETNNEINTIKNDLESLSSIPVNIFSDKEIPLGDIDGVNSLFKLLRTPILGSEHVYLNGILQESGNGNDYIILNSNITFLTPPERNSKLRCT